MPGLTLTPAKPWLAGLRPRLALLDDGALDTGGATLETITGMFEPAPDPLKWNVRIRSISIRYTHNNKK